MLSNRVVELTARMKIDSSEQVDLDIEAYDREMVKRRLSLEQALLSSASPDGVRVILRLLVELDQYMRQYSQVPWRNGYGGTDLHGQFRRMFMPRWHQLDDECTSTLKALIGRWGWFARSSWGDQADSDAWLLTQHADRDIEFQKYVLTLLEPLVATGDTRGSHYAYLFDRIAVNEGRLQRYGTQGCCTGRGTWAPGPIEDPDTVDRRRSAMGLGPLDEYIAGFRDICHEDERD